ncbi:DUF2474 domain-containing protein [Gammaproteobacteria bacterium ESL0073]|nr:DUF2474 domain-containing protein [Gammaproteobacteria bacterium ESL0073]
MQVKLAKTKKILWFLGLWCAGVIGLSVLSGLIKLLMYWAGLRG